MKTHHNNTTIYGHTYDVRMLYEMDVKPLNAMSQGISNHDLKNNVRVIVNNDFLVTSENLW